MSDPDELEDAALFELVPAWRMARRGVTATRTERHRFLISIGFHPLSLILHRTLRLHWRASHNPFRNRSHGLPRCGTCIHLARLDREPGSPLKCFYGGRGERVSRGNATTVRKWWPGCSDWEVNNAGDDKPAA